MIGSRFTETVGQAPQKRSEATKRMLSAPEPSQEDRCVMVSQKHAPVEQYLPGLPSSDKATAFLHCRCASDLVDSACFATLVKGGRCSRPRMKTSNFCKQHSHEVLKQERQQECWQSMAASFQEGQHWQSIIQCNKPI
jgi:hypothetical protein